MKTDLEQVLTTMSLAEVATMLDAIAGELNLRALPSSGLVRDAAHALHAYRAELARQRRDAN